MLNKNFQFRRELITVLLFDVMKMCFQIKAEEVREIADEAKADLALAMPAMEAAQNALKSLNKADINELKAFQKPPALVRFVMEPVCILLGAK